MAHILCIVLLKTHFTLFLCWDLSPCGTYFFPQNPPHVILQQSTSLSKKSERKLKFLFYICILLKNINHNPHGQTSKMFSNQAHSTPVCVTEWHCLDTCLNCHSKYRTTSHLFSDLRTRTGQRYIDIL